MPEVVQVGQEAIEQVARTVAASFADDPIWKWVYNTTASIPVDTGMVMARMIAAQSLPIDAIHAAADHGAVALWTAPLRELTPELEAVRDQQAAPYFKTFAAQIGGRLSTLGELSVAMKKNRPEEPHWYLGILGTAPERQGQGLGSAVLSKMLTHCDDLGLPTYLESSNPRNYDFYRRHGYVDVDELVVLDSPPLLGFFRAPQ